MTQNDLAALRLAIEQTRTEPDRSEQITSMLEDRSWIEVATFAAYHRQMDRLRLDPWQSPPCWIDDADATLADDRGDRAWHYGEREAARLLKKMLALGISQYHPDPIRAIEQAETRGL